MRCGPVSALRFELIHQASATRVRYASLSVLAWMRSQAALVMCGAADASELHGAELTRRATDASELLGTELTRRAVFKIC